MNDRDRFRLLDAYQTLCVRIGRVLACEARDCDVIVVGYGDGRIPWPVGRRKATSIRSLVVFGGLADAIRRARGTRVAALGAGSVPREDRRPRVDAVELPDGRTRTAGEQRGGGARDCRGIVRYADAG